MMDRPVPMTPERLAWLISEAEAGRTYTDQGASDELQAELDKIAAEAGV
jgi:hypothetical protein